MSAISGAVSIRYMDAVNWDFVEKHYRFNTLLRVNRIRQINAEENSSFTHLAILASAAFLLVKFTATPLLFAALASAVGVALIGLRFFNAKREILSEPSRLLEQVKASINNSPEISVYLSNLPEGMFKNAYLKKDHSGTHALVAGLLLKIERGGTEGQKVLDKQIYSDCRNHFFMPRTLQKIENHFRTAVKKIKAAQEQERLRAYREIAALEKQHEKAIKEISEKIHHLNSIESRESLCYQIHLRVESAGEEGAQKLRNMIPSVLLFRRRLKEFDDREEGKMHWDGFGPDAPRPDSLLAQYCDMFSYRSDQDLRIITTTIDRIVKPQSFTKEEIKNQLNVVLREESDKLGLDTPELEEANTLKESLIKSQNDLSSALSSELQRFKKRLGDINGSEETGYFGAEYLTQFKERQRDYMTALQTFLPQEV